MTAHRTYNALGYVGGTLAVLLLAAATVQADNKKAAAPAKAAPAKPAAKPAAGGAAKGPAAGGAASHGPTTTGGAKTTTGGGGITTSGRSGGATTTGARGATTTGARPTTTTGGAGAKAGAPAAAGARPAATAGARPAASPAARSMPHTASGAPPKGSTMRSTPKGDQVRMRAGGKPGDVHVAGKNMDIHHGLAGGRTSRVERADHSRIVAERGGRGYVQHPYGWHGHEYGHRTYWAHGRAYDRFYAGYPYHGVYVEMYSPAFYYPPAFYGWAYNPWAVPIAYPVAAWGWGGAPWYGVYGGFFTPFPVYASASLWLTDYMISTTLAAAYQANADAAAAQQAALAPDAAPLTPDVKNLIAQEVQRQIAVENAEAAPQQQAAGPNPAVSGVQRLLSDNQSHVFVAGAAIDVVDANSNECAVSDGDVLQLTPTPLPDDATAATLVVMTSKGGVECKKGAAVTVNIEDLQDMQNHMREAIDTGMQDLKDKQGKGGLPALPPSASGMPVKAQFAMDAPPPDATAQQQITAQAQDADKAEQEVLAQAGSGPADAGAPAAPAPAAAPVEIALGQTVDQVTASLGQPKNIVDLGAKKIYVFKDMKVTFKDGKVSDVQ